MVGDHAHPLSLIGTIEDDMTTTPNVPLRDRVRAYNLPVSDLPGAEQGRLSARASM